MKIKVSADIILYGVSIANSFRLAWAYAYADAGGNVLSLPGVFGLGIGATASLGIAYVSGKIPGKMTAARKRLAWAVLVIALLLEIMILSPLTLSDIPDKLRLTLGWAAPLWSVVLALLPSLIMAGVAFASGNLVADTAEPKAFVAQPAAEPRKPGKKAGAVACRHGCNHVPMTQDGENAHSRWCKNNPVNQPVAVDFGRGK